MTTKPRKLSGFIAVIALGLALGISAHPTTSYAAVKCGYESSNLPAEVCKIVWGGVMKVYSAFAIAPHISPFNYNGCWIADCNASDNGYPKECLSPGQGSVGRKVNTTGAGSGSVACLTRIQGDDQTKENGGPRIGALPPLFDKGKDACLYIAERAAHIKATLAAAARCPETPYADCNRTTPRVAFGYPSVICRSLDETVPPDPNLLMSTYDGKDYPPGTLLAANVVQGTVNPDTPRLFSGFPDPLEPSHNTPFGKSNRYANFQSASLEGMNKAYDRRKETKSSIIAAENVLFPKTLAYQTYDPSDQSIESERDYANELAAVEPHIVAQIRQEKNGWLDANAATGNSSILVGIMCQLRPSTCHLTSHFDKGGTISESYYAGLARDNQISTPGVEFYPDLGSTFKNLGEQMKNIGGSLAEQLYSNLLNPKKQSGAVSRDALINCLNAMRKMPASPSTAQLSQTVSNINNTCPNQLLSSLQSSGGFSLENLNIWYQAQNAGQKLKQSLSSSNTMPDVSEFIFNGNPLANIGGLTPSNLGSLAGADIGMLNKVLMQRVPNLPQIGGLKGNKGRFFGNKDALPKSITDLKSNPYIQSFFPETFDMRSRKSMFPERDHYSPCAGDKTCYVSRNEAPLSFFEPWYNGNHSESPLSEKSYQNMLDQHDKLIESNSPDCFGASCSDDAIGIESPTVTFTQRQTDEESMYASNRRNEAFVSSGIKEIATQFKNFLPKLTADNRNLWDNQNPDSPLNFGPNPSHKAIGMPFTSPETGPLLFRDDGTVYYANRPNEKVNFIAKDIYTIDDVDKGILPKTFANFVRKNEMEPWDKLAMIISKQGSIDFMTPEQIDTLVASINKGFRDAGTDAFITKDIFRQSAADFAEYIGQDVANLNSAATAEKATLQPTGKSEEVASLLTNLGLSEALAAPTPLKLPTGAAEGKKASNKVSKYRDVVRCSGDKDNNQIRVDVMSDRYERFNGHVLQRIVYNRWAYADGQNPARCLPGQVCAPKPCPGRMSAWSKACWKKTHRPQLGSFCTFPAIQVGPNNEFPLSAVRFDYGSDSKDIGHKREINNYCPKIPSPNYKPAKGGCHFYDRVCRQTRAYNCRIYGGEKLCGYTWAYHPDVKYILSQWADQMNGDFTWDVGERHMKDECKTLAECVPNANKLDIAPMEAAAKADIQIPMQSSFPESFGIRRPYICLDSTGSEYGQKPGMPADFKSAKGAYIFASNSSATTEELKKMAQISPLDNNVTQSFASQMLGHLSSTASAFAAGKVYQGSAMPMAGGPINGGGNNACPLSNGMDPDFNTLPTNAQQQENIVKYGLNCQPSERVLWAESSVAMYSKICGAPITMEIDDNPNAKNLIRTITYPLPLTQNWLHPSGWNGSAGAPKLEEKKGIESLMELEGKAGCSIITFPDGMGEGVADGLDSKRSPPMFMVVDSVNNEKGYVSAHVKNGDRFFNAAMQNPSSEVFLRTLYLPGKFPAALAKEFENQHGYYPYCYKTPASKGQACEMSDEDLKNGMVYYAKVSEDGDK